MYTTFVLVLGAVFLSFVLNFIMFIIQVTIQVEQYHKDGIFATIITTLVPSSALATLGYVVKRIVESDTNTTEPAHNKEIKTDGGAKVKPQARKNDDSNLFSEENSEGTESTDTEP